MKYKSAFSNIECLLIYKECLLKYKEGVPIYKKWFKK